MVTSLTTLMLYIHFFKYQRVGVTVVGFCRFGVWKEVKKCLWTRPPMDSSLEVTATWCCIHTRREAERSILSTPGECNLFSMAGFTC